MATAVSRTFTSGKTRARVALIVMEHRDQMPELTRGEAISFVAEKIEADPDIPENEKHFTFEVVKDALAAAKVDYKRGKSTSARSTGDNLVNSDSIKRLAAAVFTLCEHLHRAETSPSASESIAACKEQVAELLSAQDKQRLAGAEAAEKSNGRGNCTQRFLLDKNGVANVNKT